MYHAFPVADLLINVALMPLLDLLIASTTPSGVAVVTGMTVLPELLVTVTLNELPLLS